MTSRAAERDVHYLSGLTQTQILVEHEVQRLALPRRQTSQSLLKSLLHFRSFKLRLMWRGELRFRVRAGGECQRAQQMLAAVADRYVPDHGEQPLLQLAVTAIDGFALQDFQVNRLQNFFSVGAVVLATSESPAVTGLMKSFEFRFQFREL